MKDPIPLQSQLDPAIELQSLVMVWLQTLVPVPGVPQIPAMQESPQAQEPGLVQVAPAALV